MRHTFREATVLIAFSVIPSVVHAGWVSTWTNTPIGQKGERKESQNASMAISGGRVRLEQPEVITVIDYNADRFTLMNPVKQYFWSGTVDEYLRQMNTNRAEKLRAKFEESGKVAPPKKPEGDAPPKVDPAKLPPLSITKTALTEKIAGYDTVKYEIHTDGALFQEVWVAPTLDVSSDLDPARYFATQRKMGAAMLGKSAGQYNALYLNDEYRKLIEKAFVLKIVTHHMAGGFERSATSVRQADVPDSQFAVPEDYRKVRLTDVITGPQGS